MIREYSGLISLFVYLYIYIFLSHCDGFKQKYLMNCFYLIYFGLIPQIICVIKKNIATFNNAIFCLRAYVSN